jgi:hypothetical protein
VINVFNFLSFPGAGAGPLSLEDVLHEGGAEESVVPIENNDFVTEYVRW